LLLPEVSGAEVAGRARATTDAVRVLGLEGLLVIVSPHGGRAGIYREVRGTLATRGAPHVRADRTPEGDLADEIARRSGLDVIDGPVDHGVIVPLRLMANGEHPVVAISVTSEMEGTKVGAALADLDVSFVASANTSAALSPRAPLTFRPEAERSERTFVDRLRNDAGAAAVLASELELAGGSCSAPSLAAFGTLFAGCPVEVLAHEHPYGVGYVVGRATRDG
jgi:aromatic ring-opening dioxygenase LigB subunit